MKNEIVLPLLIALVFGAMFAGPLWINHIITKERDKQYHKIYDACVADGQKPYYCDSLASK